MRRRDFRRSQKTAGELAENGLSEKARWYSEVTEGAAVWKTDDGYYITYDMGEDVATGPMSFEEVNRRFEEMADDLMEFIREEEKNEE